MSVHLIRLGVIAKCGARIRAESLHLDAYDMGHLLSSKSNPLKLPSEVWRSGSRANPQRSIRRE